MPSIKYLALALSGLVTLAACSATDGTAPAGQAQLSLNVASQSRSGTGASARTMSLALTSPTPGTFTDGTNTVVFTSVKVVLRKIELERVGDDGACDALSATVTSTVSADDQGDDHGDATVNGEACEELEVGPLVFDVPVTTAGAQHTVSVTVEPGTFEKVEFQIHKPEDGSSDDAAFLAANPGFDKTSIKVEGTWNGAPFTFSSDLNAEQKMELSPPLVVTQSGATNLTIFFDVSTWFAASGGTLIDPSTAVKGQPNEDVVKDNIKRSLHAFRDNDEDGAED
jgi:hypothetical protein